MQMGAAALLLLGHTSVASAQVLQGNQWPKPRLTAITPPGGKVGTTFEVGFLGSDLDLPQSLYFTHPGIKATPIVPPPPKPDPKADPKKPVPPPPPVTKFSVTIDKNVPLGYYDVRFVNAKGISNPRVFVVGDLKEELEKEPNNDVEQAQKVEIGTTISGVVSAPTDVDYCSFAGKKGQRLVITCLCTSIDSRLHPELKLLDSGNRQIAYSRPLPGNDGVLDVTLPADGDYQLRLNQFTYTLANNDYFYRLNIAAAPYIESVFPPMIEPGKTDELVLLGRNLPGGKPEPTAVVDGQPLDKLVVKVQAPADPLAQHRLAYSGLVTSYAVNLDGFEYRLQSPNGPSNPMLVTYARAPVIVEKDSNDTAEAAQAIPIPCELAGRVDKRQDRDWFVIQCKKGDTYVLELMSHRLGAPTDMYFLVRNLEGKQPVDVVPLQDDDATTPNNKHLYTASLDPAPFRFVAPADGKFHILVASQRAGILADPTHVYRLRITQEQPDFRLVVMPAEDFRPDSLLLGQGSQQTYDVFAFRRDGFKGDITISMENLPTGVTCPPQVMSANTRFVPLAVIAADNAPVFTGEVKVTGTAIINGQKVVREARPATVTWGVQAMQNIPTVTRLNRSLVLAVRDFKTPGKIVATPDKAVVSLGDKLNINLKLQRVSPDFKANFQITPLAGEIPANVTFPNLTFAPGKDDQTAVLAVAANALPGTYNVVFRGFAPISPDPKAKPVNTVLASSPVTLTILPKQVANLSVDNANPTVQMGKQGAVLVKVARLFDYGDSFKVELILPPGTQGVAADPIVIPAGANEAKLMLRVPENTPPGARANLTIRAVAVVNGNVTLVHETKINVNVVK
jgi:hypothetical protein